MSVSSKMSIQERIRAMNQTIDRVVDQDDSNNIPYEDATVSTMTMSIKEYDDDDDDDSDFDDDYPKRRSVVDMWRKREVATSTPKQKPGARKWNQNNIIKEDEKVESPAASKQQGAPLSVVDMIKSRTATSAVANSYSPANATPPSSSKVSEQRAAFAEKFAKRVSPTPTSDRPSFSRSSPKEQEKPQQKKDLVIVNDNENEDIRPKSETRTSVAAIWQKRGLASSSPKIQTEIEEEEVEAQPTPRRGSVADVWTKRASPANSSNPSRSEPQSFSRREKSQSENVGQTQDDAVSDAVSDVLSNASTAAARWKRRQSASRSLSTKKSSPSWLSAAETTPSPQATKDEDQQTDVSTDWLGSQPSPQVKSTVIESSARSEISTASSSAAARWRERSTAGKSPRGDEPSWKQSSSVSDVGTSAAQQWKQRTAAATTSAGWKKNIASKSTSAAARSWNQEPPQSTSVSARIWNKPSPTQGAIWNDDSMDESNLLEEVAQMEQGEESLGDERDELKKGSDDTINSSSLYSRNSPRDEKDEAGVGRSSVTASWKSRSRSNNTRKPVQSSKTASPVEWGSKSTTEGSSQRESAAAFWNKQSPTATSMPTWKRPAKDTSPSWVKPTSQEKKKQDNLSSETPKRTISESPGKEESRSVSGALSSANGAPPSSVNKSSSSPMNNVSSSSSSSKPEWMTKLKRSSPRNIPIPSSPSSSKPAWMNTSLRRTGRLTPTRSMKESDTQSSGTEAGNGTIEANEHPGVVCVSNSSVSGLGMGSAEEGENSSKRRNPNWKNISIDISNKETIDSAPISSGQSTEETRPETKTPESSPRNANEVAEAEGVTVELLEDDDVGAAGLVEAEGSIKEEVEVTAEFEDFVEGLVESTVEEHEDIIEEKAEETERELVNEGHEGKQEDDEIVPEESTRAQPAAIATSAGAGFGIETLNLVGENKAIEENLVSENETEVASEREEKNEKDETGMSAESKEVPSHTHHTEPVTGEIKVKTKLSADGNSADELDEAKSHGQLLPSSNIEEEDQTLSPSPSSAFETFDQIAATPKTSTVKGSQEKEVASNDANDFVHFDPSHAGFFPTTSLAPNKASTVSKQNEGFDPFFSSSSSEDGAQRKSESFSVTSLQGQNISMEEYEETSVKTDNEMRAFSQGFTSNGFEDNYLPTNLAHSSGFADAFDSDHMNFFSQTTETATFSSQASKASSKVDSFDPFADLSSDDVNTTKEVLGSSSKLSRQVDTFNPFDAEESTEDDGNKKSSSSFNSFDPSKGVEGLLEWPQATKRDVEKATKDKSKPEVETKATPMTLRQRAQVWKMRSRRGKVAEKNTEKAAGKQELLETEKKTRTTTKKKSNLNISEKNMVAPKQASAIDLAMQYSSPARKKPVQESEGSAQRLGARSISSLFRNDGRGAAKEDSDAHSTSSNQPKHSSPPRFSARRVKVAQKFLSKDTTKPVGATPSSDLESVNNSERQENSLQKAVDDSGFEVIADTTTDISAESSSVTVEPVTSDSPHESNSELVNMDPENDQDTDHSYLPVGGVSSDSVSLNLNTEMSLKADSSVTTQSSMGLQSAPNKVRGSKVVPIDPEPSSPPKPKKEMSTVAEQLNSGLRDLTRMNCADNVDIDPDDFVHAYLPASLTPASPERNTGISKSPRRSLSRSPGKSGRSRQKQEVLTRNANPEVTNPEVTNPEATNVSPQVSAMPPASPATAKATLTTATPELNTLSTPKRKEGSESGTLSNSKQETPSSNRKPGLSPASLTRMASRASKALSERRNRRSASVGKINKEDAQQGQNTEVNTQQVTTPSSQTTEEKQIPNLQPPPPPPPPPPAQTRPVETNRQILSSKPTENKSPVDRTGFVNRYQQSDRYINDEQSRDSSRGGTMSAHSFGSEFSYGASSTDAESTTIAMTRSTSGFSQSTGADTGAITVDSSFQEENPLTLSGIKDAYESSVSSFATGFKKEMEATFSGMKDFTTGFSFGFNGDSTSFRNSSSLSRKPIGSIESWRSIETAEEEVAIEVEYIGTRQDSYEEMELAKAKQKSKAFPPAGQSSYEAKL